MFHKLENYLRTYRKRTGLSQREIAYLLGCQDGNTASRYERSAREPGLQIVLAYEVCFRVPPWELFAGVYERVAQRIAKRARALSEQVAKEQPSPLRDQKLAALKAMVSPTACERNTTI